MSLRARVAEHPVAALLRLGFAAALAQAVLLQEAMAALGGSELAWGVVLAVWLAGMGIGARFGVRHGTAPAARLLPPGLLVAAAGGAVLFRATPALAGATAGEAITTWHTLWIWILAVLPAAMLGGLAFPVLAAEPAAGDAGRAYAWEALGALAGGLIFTVALARWGSAVTLAVGFGLTGALGCRRRLAASGLLLAGVVAAVTCPGLLAGAGWRWAGRTATLAAWAETRQQRLELGRDEDGGVVLFADGRLLATYPDPYLTAPRAHLLLLLHPHPRRVLLSGGLADGTVSHLLRHPVERLQLVEEDPALLRLLPVWYGQEMVADLANGRVSCGTADPVRALDAARQWDLILLLGGNPTTLRHNRRCSLELLRQCQRSLAPDGILVLQLAVGDTYLGGAAGRLLQVIVATLRRVFAEVVALPGEQILLVAGNRPLGDTVDPDQLIRRWHERRLSDPAFIPEMLHLLVDPLRCSDLNRALQQVAAPVNTMNRPRAVLLAAGLTEARGQPPLLNLLRELEARSPTPLLLLLTAVAALLLVAAALRRAAGTATAAVVGATSMGWWLLLMASWQGAFGSVYAEIGALSAAFMTGLAGGAGWARRWSQPQRALPALLLGGVIVSGAIAAGVATLAPLLAIPLLMMAGGALTGAAFAGVARLAGRGSIRLGAGLGFAADEAGAAVAALLVGVLALPWAGLRATALGLAALQLATLPVVLRRRG